MIFKNICFHNVEELEPCDGGYKMYRVPENVRAGLNERAKELVSSFSTGVELRFKIKGDSAALILRAEPAEEAQTAFIYYGSFQGGWENSSKTIYDRDTRITIHVPANAAVLKKIYRERNLGFDPEVVRVVLPYGTCIFVGVEGDVEPPRTEELPAETYLAYGSSITHGSLALTPASSYPFRIAQKMNCDYLNLGMAGSAHLEECMAEYIVSRKDWNFASVEMGINMLGPEFSLELFEERVKAFLEVISRDSRLVFLTSVFGFIGEYQEKAEAYRKIVSECAGKYADKNIIFTDGLELLNNPAFISQDLTHPTLEGLEEIAAKWHRIMASCLEGQER